MPGGHASNQQNSSTKSSTGWSVGAEETLGVKASVGDPDKATGFSAGDTFSAQQPWQGSVQDTYGETQESSFNVTRW
jgi:hypothetical protein